MSCSPAAGHLGGDSCPLFSGEIHHAVPTHECSPCPCRAHQPCQTAAPALPHFLWQQFWGCSRVSRERAAPTTRVWSVLWDTPCAARHSLPMAGAGFGPRTGLSPCSTAQMRCSSHLDVSFPELAACIRGTQRCQLRVTCSRCFPGFLPCHCVPDSVRGKGLGFFYQLYLRGVGCRAWHSTHSRVLCTRRSFMGHAGFLTGV